jgi:hypothetical protein
VLDIEVTRLQSVKTNELRRDVPNPGISACQCAQLRGPPAVDFIIDRICNDYIEIIRAMPVAIKSPDHNGPKLIQPLRRKAMPSQSYTRIATSPVTANVASVCTPTGIRESRSDA